MKNFGGGEHTTNFKFLDLGVRTGSKALFLFFSCVWAFSIILLPALNQLLPAPNGLFKTQFCYCLLYFEKGVGCREKLGFPLLFLVGAGLSCVGGFSVVVDVVASFSLAVQLRH